MMASGNISGLVPQPYITFKTVQGNTIEVWKDHSKWWGFRCGDVRRDFRHLPLNDLGLSYHLYNFCEDYNFELVDSDYTSKCIERVSGLK